MSKGVIDVKVHSGELAITIQYKDQILSESFKRSKEQQEFIFELKKVEGYYGSVVVVFKALQDDTVYSAHVKEYD